MATKKVDHLRRAWISLLAAVAIGTGAAQAEGICNSTWDGDKLAERARSVAPMTQIRLWDGSGRQLRAQVTAQQVLAFHEAKEAISRQLQRRPQFVICDSPDPNAFATRVEGGELMGVTAGMLNLIDGDRDMAAHVVGHEMAHHVKNHMEAGQARRAMLALAGLLVGAVLETRLQRNDKRSPGLGLDLGALGARLVSRKFDRDQEREADDLGLQYLADSGFSPQGAVRLAQRMQRLGGSSGWFLESHPGWQERGERMQQQIASSPALQQVLARTGPSTRVASATPRLPEQPGQVVAAVVSMQDSTEAQRSYTDGMVALLRANHAAGLRHMRLAAQAGYAPAQFAVGWLLINAPEGVAKDEAEGVRFYKLAADQGQPLAVNNLGVLHATGKAGVPQSNAEALRLYRRASELGDAAAAKNLAEAYFFGQLGLQRDPAVALPLFRMAHDRGQTDATWMLSLYSLEGLAGVPRDEARALELARSAADRGSVRAQFGLALLRERGDGMAKDAGEALRYYKLAADQGHVQSQVNLGLMLMNGQGASRDDVQAAQLFRAAAEKGNPRAQITLAYMYESGRGVAADGMEALRWYRRAADQGDPMGQTSMGRAYAEGLGVPKDDVEAVRWFRLAAAQGFESARNELKKRNLN